MDSGEDFLTPEFLNILFFQQKNLVIYPYVDLKHLHSLEVFTASYSHIDLESTALNDLRQVLELESESSYSQSPTFYFIYNIERSQVKDVLSMDNIRCVLNSNDAISDLADGGRFVFYNKKNNHFLNYSGRDLEFENHLISSAQSREVLYDSIQKIKSTASLIFAELNNNNSFANLPEILKDYDSQYWQKILNFTKIFFEINIPKVEKLGQNPQEKVNKKDNLQDFSDEYEAIVSTNKNIGKEFIQCLHEYRSKKVNASHLELEDMFNPQRLYNYLRNRHWKEGIPPQFLEEWRSMNKSQYKLTEIDHDDFDNIFEKLNISPVRINKNEENKLNIKKVKKVSSSIKRIESRPIPSVNNFSAFKSWMFEILDETEKLLGVPSKIYNSNTNNIPLDQIRERLKLKLNQVFFKEWIELYKVEDKFRFLVRFIANLSNLHASLYGEDKKKDMPIKIKEFKFTKSIEKKLIAINRLRNNISHKGMNEEEINLLLKHTFTKIKKGYFCLLVYLAKTQIFSVLKYLDIGDEQDHVQKVKDYLVKTYFKEFSSSDLRIVIEIFNKN